MKNLTLKTEAQIEYRSNYANGCTCLNPDSWCSAIAEDEDGNEYKVWFEIKDTERELEDACDWNDLSDYEEI